MNIDQSTSDQKQNTNNQSITQINRQNVVYTKHNDLIPIMNNIKL